MKIDSNNPLWLGNLTAQGGLLYKGRVSLEIAVKTKTVCTVPKSVSQSCCKDRAMTPEHKKYLNYNEAEFTAWGRSVGKHTATVVRYFLTNGKETEQGYKACTSMTKLADRYGTSDWKTAASVCWQSLLRRLSERSVPFSRMRRTKLPRRKSRRRFTKRTAWS